MCKIRPLRFLIRALCGLFVAVGVGSANSSLDLTAANGYAVTFDSPTFDFEGSFTIDLRFRSPAAHTGCLLAKFHQSSGTAQDDSYYILVQSNGDLEARIQTQTMLVTLAATGNTHDAQWHHVALVYDIDAETAELYLDGDLGDAAFLTTPLRDTEEQLRLGALRTTGSLASYFDGQIDELRFWDIARRGEQASCLKDVTLLLDTPGLVSYYPFDEEAGTSSGDMVAPFENFTFISGATFSVLEPAFLSRLSGPGACYCGAVSGNFLQTDPAITLVGDTVTVPEGDSLTILSNALILDSTVAVVRAYGKLSVTGTEIDSSYILGQYAAASMGEIHLLTADTIVSDISFTRLSGFGSRTLCAYSPLKISDFAASDNPGGALLIGADAEIDSSLFQGCDSAAVEIDSGAVNLLACDFLNNGGGLIISAPCSVTVKQSNFQQNVKPSGAGGAIRAIGDFAGGAGSYLGLEGCGFIGNSAENGGALACENMHIDVRNSNFEGNSATTSGGAISASATAGNVCRVLVDSTEITGNSASSGAAIHLQGSPGTAPVEFSLRNGTVSGNTGGAAMEGMGVTQAAGFSALIERIQFYDNHALGGATGAIMLTTPYDGSTVKLHNLTIVGNTGNNAAVQINQPTIVRNCILTANGSAAQLTGIGLSVVYTIISDEEYLGGPGGNFDADPLFYDYLERDFRLTAGSPAINRGDPNALFNDPDGTRGDIGALRAETFAAEIESVLDVPQDNGRRVMIQWLPSPGDDNRAGIEKYQVFREVNLPVLENYELLAEIPASQLPGYGQIVTTLADSNMSGQPWFRYFVRAKSVNPLAFWDTPIDSGYSVDDLAPEAPALLATLIANDIELTWTAAADSDFAYFEIYRAFESFDADTVPVYAVTPDSFFTDASLAEAAHAYQVIAVDHNGNRSEASNEELIVVQTLAAPQYFMIYPSSGFLEMRWLPVEGAAHYAIYQSGTPDGPGDLLAVTTGITYLTPIVEEIQFYWVVAQP